MDQGAPPPPDQQGAPPPDQQGAPQDQGSDDSGASFDQFYSGLSNQGQWVQTPDYGYVFQPTVQDPNWAPYTDGHWVYTDYGWTWTTDEPWGWATYHYGRWVNIVGQGWAWVPGYQWAPAWVSWRYGGGYAGWAPLPPATFVGVEFGGNGVNLDFGFHFGSDCDTAYGIGPGCYNFIPVGYIGNPYYHGYYADRSRNFVIINNTTNITNINISRGGTGAFGAVRTGGPSLTQVNAVSRTPIQQVRIATNGQAGRNGLSGGTLSVYAPHFNPATVHQSRPATVARSLSSVQINRGTSITHPMQVNSQFKPVAPSAAAISAAKAAAVHAPKNVATSARVAATVDAASVQKERTQLVQRQQTQTQQHPATSVNHTAAVPSNEGNAQTEHNTQLEHQQSTSNAQTQQREEQERQAAATQQRSEQNTQQQSQAETEARERAAAQQQREENTQQQSQAAAEARERAAAAAAQQERTTQEHTSPSYAPATQHTPTPQPQERAPIPQQRAAPSGGGGGSNSGQNKNNNNGQNPGQGH